MQPLRTFAALAALIIIGAGCSAILPGNDPFVVRSEQAQQAAFDTVDTFLAFEKSNRDVLWKADKSIKQAADEIRAYYPQANENLIGLIAAYKKNRSPESKFAVETALAIIAQAKQDAQGWLVRLNTGGGQ